MISEAPQHKTSFAGEMRFGFSQYAKYVISDRALPDARDGLKPVHRRLLWTMHQLGLGPRTAYKKCARIVGDCLGKYHPHAGGVYESLVRLGQDWSLRYPLVQPQGNFGSVDGYPAAAMRYTEARLERISLELLENISPNVVDFQENFDGEEQEPVVLPVKVPHLLLNGSYGIAVGISSNIPPHNLHELLRACMAIIDKPEISNDELMEHVTAPDFPTGGVIVGRNGIASLYRTGRGSIRLRSKVHVETPETHKVKKPMIVVDEIPYLQKKGGEGNLITSIAKLIDENKIRGVKDVRDLSESENLRVEIDISEQYQDETGVKTILAQLYKSTNLETPFHCRITSFVYGRPMTLDLKQSLCVFLDFREVTVRAIAQEELEKVLARIHILDGLIIASNNIDDVIALIRASETRKVAHDNLKKTYEFSDLQAKAVLDMTLARLARVEQADLVDELKEREKRREELKEIIHNRPTLLNLMKEEFLAIMGQYKEERRTTILDVDDIIQSTERPILHQRNMLATSTSEGYVRTIDYSKFKTQGRGGKGVAGVPLKEDEKLHDMVVVSNLDDLLMINNLGVIYQLPTYELREVSNRTTKGTRVIRYLPVEGTIIKIVPVEYEKYLEERVFVTVTKNGVIKRTTLDKYSNIRRTGIKCLNLREDDEVVDAFITEGNSYIFIASKNGSACLFDEDKARLMGRVAQGVRGMKLRAGDEVVSAFSIPKDELPKTTILTVTEFGYGKRTELSKYRITNRGVMGVRNMKIVAKNGKVVTSMPMPIDAGDSNISLVNSVGTLIKVGMKGIRTMGRSTQGVRVMRMRGNQTLLMASSIIDEGEAEPEVEMDAEEQAALESDIDEVDDTEVENAEDDQEDEEIEEEEE
jgi:DNA gyrase subunit A